MNSQDNVEDINRVFPTTSAAMTGGDHSKKKSKERPPIYLGRDQSELSLKNRNVQSSNQTGVWCDSAASSSKEHTYSNSPSNEINSNSSNPNLKSGKKNVKLKTSSDDGKNPKNVTLSFY